GCDRGSGWDHEIQNTQEARGGEAGERETEPLTCIRHSRRSDAPGELAEAAGGENKALFGAKDRSDGLFAAGAGGQVPTARTRDGKDCDRAEPNVRSARH